MTALVWTTPWTIGIWIVVGVSPGCIGSGTPTRSHGPDVGSGDTGGEVMVLDETGDSAPDTGLADPDVAWVSPTCGDGVLDPTESCDDGNRLDGDGCDWACRPGDGSGSPGPEEGAGSLIRELGPLPVHGATRGDPRLGTGASSDPQVPFLWTGEAYATVWVDDALGFPNQIARFVRFDREGERVGAEWEYFYEGRRFSRVALGWSGELFALVWCPWFLSGPVSGLFLDREGKPLGSPVTLAESGTDCRPALTISGSDFVVAWTTPTSDSLHVVRWRSLEGSTPDPVIELPLPHCGESPGRPVIAATAHVVVVAYHEWGGGDPAESECEDDDIRWLNLDASSLEVAGPVAALGRQTGRGFDVAKGAGVAVVAYLQPSRFPYPPFLARLTSGGSLAGPPQALRCPGYDCGHEGSMSVAWGDGGWVVGAHPGGPSPVLFRTDRFGVTTWSDSMPSWPSNFVLEVAFDGEGFGILGLDDTGPVFARYAIAR